MQKQGSEHFWRKIKGFSKSSRSKILKIIRRVGGDNGKLFSEDLY